MSGAVEIANNCLQTIELANIVLKHYSLPTNPRNKGVQAMPNGIRRTSLAVMAAAGLMAVSAPGGVALVPGLKITSFTPAGGLTGSTVVVTGTGFTGVTSVQIGGKAAAYTVGSATQITVTVPTAPLTGYIRIATPAGAVQSAQMFTVVKTPPSLPTFTPYISTDRTISSGMSMILARTTKHEDSKATKVHEEL